MAIPGTIGGDIIKGYYLVKNESVDRGKSAGIILIDRIIGLFSILFIAIISLIYILYKYFGTLNSHVYELKLILKFGVFLSCIVFIFIILAQNQNIRKKMSNILFSVFKKGIIHHMMKGIGVIIKTPFIMLKALIISLLLQLLSLMGLFFLSGIVSENLPNIMSLIAISSIVMLFGMVPVTPGNIGWTETVATIAWKVLGSNAGAAIFLYWRIIIIFCVMPWGFIYYKFLKSGVIDKNRVSVVPKIEEF